MSSPEIFKKTWFIFKLATKPKCQILKAVPQLSQAAVKCGSKEPTTWQRQGLAPQGAGALGSWDPDWREASLHPETGQPEYSHGFPFSTVQLSHALRCQPWGSWKIPDSKRTHRPSLEGSKMSKFVTFNWPWVKISNCRPSKVPVTRNLAKVMYVRELEADRNSFKYKLTDKILFHNGFLFLNIYVISR